MKKIRFKQLILAIIIIGIILFVFIRYPIFKSVLAAILISFIISYALKPLQQFLISKGLSKKSSTFIIIFGILIFLVGNIALVIPWFSSEGESFKTTILQFKVYYDNIYGRLSVAKESKIFSGMAESIYERSDVFLDGMMDKFAEECVALAGNMMLICIIPLIVYFFLTDGNHIFGSMMKYLPIKSKYSLRTTGMHIDKVMGRYVVSQFELCGVIGVFTYIVLLFTRVRFPLILASINAIFNIIPYFGPVIGAIPIIIITLLTSTKKAIIVTVWLVIIQQVEGDIIGPKVLGDSVDSHPLTILLLLIIGENLAGIFGMVLIVPIWTMAKIVMSEIEGYLF